MKTSFPLASILITSYDHSNFVVKAIQSIERQTYRNKEIIIIDDGSKDNSTNLINDYLKNKKTSEITFVSKKRNQGLKQTLEKGFDLCKGKYIAFCESDDFLEPDCLKKKINVLEKNENVSLVFSNINPVYNTKLTSQMQDYLRGLFFFGKHYFFKGNIFDYNIFKFNPVASFSNIVIRKKHLEHLSILKEYELWSDLQLLIHISKQGKFFFIKDKLTNWRIHHKSVNFQLKQTSNFYQIASKFNNRFSQKPILSFRQKAHLFYLKFIFGIIAPGVLLRKCKRHLLS